MVTGVKYVTHILRIDCKTKKIKREVMDDETTRMFIGGMGTAIKIMYDEIIPGIDPLSPENKIILSAGPFCGTRIPGSGTYQASCLSPLTGYGTSSQANGYFGARMRHAGHEMIILENASDEWEYIWIHDDQVEFRSAAHLYGVGCWKTQEILREESGYPKKASVSCIGPAGENLVPYAVLESDFGHVVATGGHGAVMGSKKIKAVVISSDKNSSDVWDEAFVQEARKNLLNAAYASRICSLMRFGGTLNYFDIMPVRSGQLTKNFSTNVPWTIHETPERESYIGKKKKTTCWACPIGHTGVVEIIKGKAAGGTYEEPEYEGATAFTSNIGNTDFGHAIKLSSMCEEVGIDHKEAGFAISLAYEAYEAGLLTKEDCDGLELNWGNADACEEVILAIGHRKGKLGELLAQGTRAASKAIGGEALNMGVYTGRGYAPNLTDHRYSLSSYYNLALSESGSFYGAAATDPQIGNDFDVDPDDPAVVGKAFARGSTKWVLTDVYGCCMFFTHGDLIPTLDAVNDVTGLNLTLDDLLTVGDRIRALYRAYNIRCGLTKDIEIYGISPRHCRPPVDGPNFGRINKMLYENIFEDYYEKSGWDIATSKPLPETLKKMNLEYVIKQIW